MKHSSIAAEKNPVSSNRKGHLSVVQNEAFLMMQLVVPVVRSVKCQMLLDTGCSFTLMQDHLWRCICKSNETLKPCADHTFVLADGRIKHAIGRVQLVFTLADKMWTLKTFVMTKAQLAFPLVLRIDFTV